MRDHFLIKIRIHSKVFMYDLFYILIAFFKCFVVYILTWNRWKIPNNRYLLNQVYGYYSFTRISDNQKKYTR